MSSRWYSVDYDSAEHSSSYHLLKECQVMHKLANSNSPEPTSWSKEKVSISESTEEDTSFFNHLGYGRLISSISSLGSSCWSLMTSPLRPSYWGHSWEHLWPRASTLGWISPSPKPHRSQFSWPSALTARQWPVGTTHSSVRYFDSFKILDNGLWAFLQYSVNNIQINPHIYEFLKIG